MRYLLSFFSLFIFLTACESNLPDENEPFVLDEILDSDTEVAEMSKEEQTQKVELADCKEVDDLECEIAVYREMYEAGDRAGGDYLVSLYRREGDFEAAYSMTAEIASDYPDLAGRMLIWDGDIALNQEEDIEKARAFYERAVNEYGDQQPYGDDPTGILALRQLSDSYLFPPKDPILAGAAYRRMLQEYPEYLDAAILFEAIVLETAGKGSGGYSYSGGCGSPYCLFENGQIRGVDSVDEVPDDYVSSDYSGYFFKLSESDQVIFDMYQ